MMLYFDTEFTGLHKNTTLISLGIISDSNKVFYAEFTDYDKSQVNEWITKNVIQNLKFNDHDVFVKCTDDYTYVKGDTDLIKSELLKWCNQFKSIQFVADVSHYDFVLLCELFGGALDLPNNISPVCFDINQELARVNKITCKEAFEIDRCEYINQIENNFESDLCKHIRLQPTSHNALEDAIRTRELFHLL